MNYPKYAILNPLENETTSQFRERRYELYNARHIELDDKAKADIEKEINQFIMRGLLIIDR